MNGGRESRASYDVRVFCFHFGSFGGVKMWDFIGNLTVNYVFGLMIFTEFVAPVLAMGAYAWYCFRTPMYCAGGRK